MSDSGKKNFLDFNLLSRIIGLAKPYKAAFRFSIGLSLLLALLGPLRPWLVQRTIDRHIVQFDVEGIRYMCMLLLTLLITESVFRYIFNYLTAWLGQSIIRDLRVRVFSHIVGSRLRYFDQTPIGTSTTRTINDIEAVNDTFSEGLITILADFLTIAMVLSFMFYTSWELTLVSLCTLPLLLAVTRWFQEGVKKSFQEERSRIGQLNAFLQEHLSGMRIIQIFNVEEQEQKKFEEINKNLRNANVSGIWYYSLFFPAVEICLAGAVGAMVWFGSRQIISGDIPGVGIISGFILYINMMFRPLRFIADKVNTIQRGLVASERVFRLLDENEAVEDKGSFVPERIRAEISFEHVNFSYDGKTTVLHDLSFQLNAGETLAIVGSTGSGKTSTIAVLGRFYDIQQGRILLDGRDIRDYPLAYLRSRMSVVLQDVFLFAGTIFENISLRHPGISKEEVKAAAILVGADDFIQKLPGGYDYRVMERGATLSMGQRQLISFVRALVFKPDILILDEATSSIDSESEALIQQAIEKLVKGQTSIVIAHRLSTIRHAHKVMVLHQGKMIEFGSQEELLKQKGAYRRLYDMQFRTQQTSQTVG
jgi:ATP-binding cassette subfamily B multidrug efflux pump